jgi:hypothetical protein
MGAERPAAHLMQLRQAEGPRFQSTSPSHSARPIQPDDRRGQKHLNFIFAKVSITRCFSSAQSAVKNLQAKWRDDFFTRSDLHDGFQSRRAGVFNA